MVKYKNIKEINSIIISSISIFIFIAIGIVYSSNILKKETIENQLIITELNAKYLSKDLNQQINNTELFIENISSIIKIDDSKESINTILTQSVVRFPIIRSINILENEKIINSSNRFNIGLFINDNIFYPKPLFSDDILRISYPWVGRDFFTGSDVISNDLNDENDLSFLPIMKKIQIQNKTYTVIINLNNEYILNMFYVIAKNIKFDVDLLRADNVFLLSNRAKYVLGKKRKITPLLTEVFTINLAKGIENIDNRKVLSTYVLLKDFPLIIGVHLNYEKSLLNWEKKSSEFFKILMSIIIFSIIVTVILILLYRKEKEKEIQLQKKQIEDHEKFKHLFDDSHFMTLVLDQKGKILEINNSALEFLDKKRIDTINQIFLDFDCWDIAEKKAIKELFSNNKPQIGIKKEMNVLDKFQKNAILDVSIFTINKESKDYKYIVIAQNITERKRKEKKLQQAYTVFNNTKDGIVITDKLANIMDVNNAFEIITGYTKNEIIDKNTNILKSDLHTKEFYEEMWDTLATLGFWEGEIINYKKNKELYTEWLTVNVILDEKNEVLNYIGIFSDITKEKEKEALLKEKEALIYQQSKMASMGEMIENIAHQWRQPLSMISVSATGIKVQKEFGLITQEEEFAKLDAINNSAQFLSATIDDFRDFLNKEKVLSQFDLNDTISSALQLTSSKLKNRNIETVIESKKIIINGLKNELIQVLINIVNNARDALEEKDIAKKYIFIKLYEETKDAVISIKDNGGGIPKDILGKVFDPYFTTKHKSQGTGIGLYMSDQIITNHLKGTITASNIEYTYKEKKYTGACFEIRVPINIIEVKE